MATTKIWAVKDSVDRVVSYAANPEKTSFEHLKKVLAYADDTDKTVHSIDKNEKGIFVTVINCSRETAAEEMVKVQEHFDKSRGVLAYHAYQSFKTGEISPELAHQIGVQLAKKMWSDQYQVLVATHLNTGTYHNHFVINAVNLWNGKKLRCNKGTYFYLRHLSDDLCRENGLSVIEKPKGYTPRNVYFAEKRGEPTKYNLMRTAIDEAMTMSTNEKSFCYVMRKLGYLVDLNTYHKYATIRSFHDKKAVRLFQLGEEYDRETLREKMINNQRNRSSECYRLYYAFTNQNPNFQLFQHREYRVRGIIKNARKITGLYALYLYYCYRLGFLPKNNQHQPLSPEMKRAWMKIQRYTAQITLIGKEKLKTDTEVKNFISYIKEQMNTVTEARKKIRNKLRNCKDESLISEYKTKQSDYTAALAQMRKQKKIAEEIFEDLPQIKENLRIENEMQREVNGLKKSQEERKKAYKR